MVGNQARVNRVTQQMMNKATESRNMQAAALEAKVGIKELNSVDLDIRLATTAAHLNFVLQQLKSRAQTANGAYDGAIAIAGLQEDRQFLMTAKEAFNSYVETTLRIGAIQ